MKHTFFSLLLFLAQWADAQFVTKDTLIRNQWVRMSIPTGYTGDSTQMIVFFNGLGEVGSGLIKDTQKISVNGPHAFIKQGWDGKIVLTRDTVRPIVLSVQTKSWQHGRDVTPILWSILSRFPKVKTLHLTGLSMGPWTIGGMIAYRANPADTLLMYKVKTVVSVKGLQFANEEPHLVGQSLPYPQRYLPWTRNAGGKMVMIESSGDDRGGRRLDSALKPNSQFILSNLGTSGHGAFNQFFGGGGATPAVLNIFGINQNIYQWMMRQGDTTMPVTTTPPAPISVSIVASADTILVPLDTLKLSAIPAEQGVSYEWTKSSGPTASIDFPNSAETVVRGLLPGVYTFTLRASRQDNSQERAVTIRVLGAKILGVYHLLQYPNGDVELKKQ
jgi:hypothetical protein